MVDQGKPTDQRVNFTTKFKQAMVTLKDKLAPGKTAAITSDVPPSKFPDYGGGGTAMMKGAADSPSKPQTPLTSLQSGSTTTDIPPMPAPQDYAVPHTAAQPTRDQEADWGSTGQRFLTKALLSEWTESALAILHGTFDYNPDELVRDKGKHVRVYQEMTKDPYVKAGLAIKKLSVCRLPTTIVPASDAPKDVEIAEFVEAQFEKMSTSWYTLLWGVMDCANVGYSIGEINYRIVDRGRWKGKVGWDSVKSKDPYIFSFRIKGNGDVLTIVQRMGAVYRRPDVPDSGRNEFPPDKFLVNSFQPLYANPYGNSDLRAAYRAYFIKDWAWKFRAIFMEKWGSPTVVGTFPNGTSEARRHQLEQVLESIQQETTITIPEDLKIEIIRVANTANVTEYERSIADLNKEILVGILGSFLAVEEGKRTGARAAGQVHLWVAKLFIEALVYMIQEDLNRQMIQRLVDMNYPDVEDYPKIQFELSRVDDLLLEVELDSGLQQLGADISPEYLEKKYGRPIRSIAQVERPLGDAVPDYKTTKRKPTAKGASTFKNSPRVARGEKVPAAPPDDQPRTNLHEQLEPLFYSLREEVIPEDPKKIGPLKDTYAFMIRSFAALSHRSFGEVEAMAFDLAGQERAHYATAKEWMSSEKAYRRLLERLLKG